MNRLTAPRQAGVRARQGFTLAELLVALMVFAVGALAMMATSVNVMTLISSSKNRDLAATAAEARFERMRSQPCSSHTTDSTTSGGVTVTWQTVSLARTDDVTVRVRFVSNHKQQTKTYRTFLPC